MRRNPKPHVHREPTPVKPWTTKHKLCARAAALRLQAERLEVSTGSLSDTLDARRFALIAASNIYLSSEQAFRGALVKAGCVEVDRIVRWLRARAEGREDVIVEEPYFRVRLPDGRYEHHREGMPPTDVRELARRFVHGTHADQVAARTTGARVVRVIVTRRRISRTAPKKG